MWERRTASDRLRESRMNSSVSEVENMLQILKNEEYKLLTNFMSLNYDDLELYVDVTKDGNYIFSLKAFTDKLIDIGKIIN